MKHKTIFVILPISILSISTVSCSSHALPTMQKRAKSADVKPYPLDTCMVIGAKLSSTPKTYIRIHDGQEVKFCCKSCIQAFEANPEPFMKKLRSLGK